MNEQEQHTYSESVKSELLVQFRMWNNNVKAYLLDKYSQDFINAVVRDARSEFEEIITHLPYIGGSDNPFTKELFFYVHWLVFYKVLKKHGKLLEETVKILYGAHSLHLSKINSAQALEVREKWFSTERRKYEGFAGKSQEREYPDNWVWSFIEGDGEEFDSGMDICECGLLKFFKRQGAEELVPFICSADFIWDRVIDLGLKRTKTVAGGDGVCNLRWKNPEHVK